MLTPSEHKLMVSQLEETLSTLKMMPPKKCCLNCDEYNKGHCNQWQAQVPEDKREEGCDQWQERLPF